ncbi:hypothetical protein Misp06_03474 [Microbulbifer sp. NBRC 101763]|uniref:hypothetical protein n=1 Tax=Microbulbifer sp. NBRC 101763 TaxID=1113820 RepID=UPI0030A147FD
MPSYDDFLSELDNDIETAFKKYKLDFNTQEFDIKNGVYQTGIDFVFRDPNIILMKKDDKSEKKATYMTWARKSAVSVTLDSKSPPYFMTSHLSGCRMTLKFHDDARHSVTVMHVAGDTSSGTTWNGSKQRDKLEEQVDIPAPVKLERRLSVTGFKMNGKTGPQKMEKVLAKGGTTFYDSLARCFGVRGEDNKWRFYVQNLNNDEQIIGFFEIV